MLSPAVGVAFFAARRVRLFVVSATGLQTGCIVEAESATDVEPGAAIR